MKKLLWDTISQEKRMELRREYKLKPSVGVEVVGNCIINDGLTEKDLEVIPDGVLEELSPIKVEKKKEVIEAEAEKETQKDNSTNKQNEEKIETKKPFCDQCDSKGTRHKKECPNNKQNEEKID